MAGLFITLEGGDGVGKSTQATRLQQWLEQAGHQVVRTREPGGTELGRSLRELILHRRAAMDARAEALLYAADRAEHVAAVVRPALDAGAVVVQDRYLDSSVAYQGAGRVLGADEVRRLSMWAAGELLPRLTILLDLDPALARKRIDQRDTGALADDAFADAAVAAGVDTASIRTIDPAARYDRLESEQLEFHQRVREGFLALAAAEPERFLVLDAALGADVLAERIRERVSALLPAG